MNKNKQKLNFRSLTFSWVPLRMASISALRGSGAAGAAGRAAWVGACVVVMTGISPTGMGGGGGGGTAAGGGGGGGGGCNEI